VSGIGSGRVGTFASSHRWTPIPSLCEFSFSGGRTIGSRRYSSSACRWLVHSRRLAQVGSTPSFTRGARPASRVRVPAALFLLGDGPYPRCGPGRTTVPRPFHWVVIALALCSCHAHHPEPDIGGCHYVPQVGPAGHFDTTDLGTTDSALATEGLTVLILNFSWASDSLAALSSPDASLLLLRIVGVKPDSIVLMRSLAVKPDTIIWSRSSKPGAPAKRVTVPSGNYWLRTRMMGSPPLIFELALLPGSTKSIALYFQSGGLTMCI